MSSNSVQQQNALPKSVQSDDLKGLNLNRMVKNQVRSLGTGRAVFTDDNRKPYMGRLPKVLRAGDRRGRLGLYVRGCWLWYTDPSDMSSDSVQSDNLKGENNMVNNHVLSLGTGRVIFTGHNGKLYFGELPEVLRAGDRRGRHGSCVHGRWRWGRRSIRPVRIGALSR